VLRRISGLKRDEIMEGWRKVHIVDAHNLYSSPNVIRVIKLRACNTHGKKKKKKKKKKEESSRKEDLDIGRMVILKWLLEKWYVLVWAGLIWLRIGTS
jgi:hypothetical protein